MLKGHTIIETNNVNTGARERFEDDNLITSALTKFFEPLGHLKSADSLLSSQSPYYENLLGGLLLFDGQIPEQKDLLFPPASVNLTGCAVYGKQNDTTGKTRGSYNTTESEINLKDKYVKYVYDFATSQANGTVASVCLTHKYGAYTPYGAADAVQQSDVSYAMRPFYSTLHYVYPSYTGGSTGDQTSWCTDGTCEYLFLIDTAGDCAYYFKANSKKSISIVKRRTYLKSVSVFERPVIEKPVIEQTTLPDLPNGLMNGSYFTYCFDNETKALYIVTTTDYYVAKGGAFRITKISFGDWAVTEYECTNQTNETINVSSSHNSSIVYRGYLFVMGTSSPCYVYKIAVGNAADVTKIRSLGMTTVQGYPAFTLNGRIFYENNDRYLSVLNTLTNEIAPVEGKNFCGTYYYRASYTPVLGDPFYFYYSFGANTTGSFMFPAFYLATINDLTTPVTKTADKTMKVTYIIQEQ